MHIIHAWLFPETFRGEDLLVLYLEHALSFVGLLWNIMDVGCLIMYIVHEHAYLAPLDPMSKKNPALIYTKTTRDIQ